MYTAVLGILAGLALFDLIFVANSFGMKE